MQRILGILLFIIGAVGAIITGLRAYESTESFKIFGAQVTVSDADWTPVIISGAVAIIGLVLATTARRR
jgi:hypothetical protein